MHSTAHRDALHTQLWTDTIIFDLICRISLDSIFTVLRSTTGHTRKFRLLEDNGGNRLVVVPVNCCFSNYYLL